MEWTASYITTGTIDPSSDDELRDSVILEEGLELEERSQMTKTNLCVNFFWFA